MTHATPDKTSALDKLAEYRKAIAALLVPPLALLGVAFTPGSDGAGAVTPTEWVYIVIAALTGSVAVAAIPNRKPS